MKKQEGQEGLRLLGELRVAGRLHRASSGARWLHVFQKLEQEEHEDTKGMKNCNLNGNCL